MLPSTTPTNIFQSCSWRLPYLEQAHSLDEPSHERNHRIASKKIQKCESPTEFCCIRRLSEGYALLVLQTSLGPAQNAYIYIYKISPIFVERQTAVQESLATRRAHTAEAEASSSSRTVCHARAITSTITQEVSKRRLRPQTQTHQPKSSKSGDASLFQDLSFDKC